MKIIVTPPAKKLRSKNETKFINSIFFIGIFSCLIIFKGYSQVPCYNSLNDYTYTLPIGKINVISSTAGDINSDGYMDVVYLDPASKQVFTLINTNSGKLIAGNSYNIGLNPYKCVLKDIDKDNKLDIVVSNSGDSSITVLTGSGSGNFTPFTTIKLAYDFVPNQLFVADMNNDTNQDLILGSSGLQNRIITMLGNGTGSFNSPIIYNGSFQGIAEMNIGDFNNDTKLDVLTMGNKTMIHFGDGLGSFSTSSLIDGAFGITNYITNSGTGDLNNDGNLDFIAISIDFMKVYLGNGSGSFTLLLNNMQIGNQSNINGVEVFPFALADFDNDGVLDVTYSGGQNDGAFTFLRGNGNGTFSLLDKKLVHAGNTANVDICVADMNNDGRNDVVSGGYGNVGRVFSLLNNGNFNFNGIKSYDYGLINFRDQSAYEIVDINGDAFPDMLFGGCTNTNNFLSVRLSLGNGNFTTPIVFNTNSLITTGLTQLIVEDIDGDLKKDVLFLTTSSLKEGFLFKGDGAGNFIYSTTYLFNYNTTAGGYCTGKIIDFNKDGKKDIIIKTSTGADRLDIYSGDGVGNFTLLNSYTLPTNSKGYCIGDLNNDGNDDIAYVCPSGVYVMHGDGISSLTAASNYSLSSSAETVECSDMDNDGNVDLIVGSYFPGNNIALLNGTFSGIFQPANYYSTNNYLRCIKIIDIDNDGKKDIITGGGGVSVLKGMSGSNFAVAIDYPMDRHDPSNDCIRIFDINNDGANDIAKFSYDISILYGSCGITTNIINDNYSQVENIVLYPNPTHGNFSIQASSSIFKIEIFNSIGQVVITKSNINELDFEMDLSQLAPAVYLLKLYSQEGVLTKKIIKE